MMPAPRKAPLPPAPVLKPAPALQIDAPPASKGSAKLWVGLAALLLVVGAGVLLVVQPGLVGLGGTAAKIAPADSRARRVIPPALRSYEEKANQGDAGAMRYLGTCYANGLFVPQDLAEARYWYRRAAEAGSMKAREELAQLEQSAK